MFSVYVRRTWVLTLPHVVLVVAACNAARVCTLACFNGLGWATTYLNNTYGFIRHAIRVVILYNWYVREKLLPGALFLDTMTIFDRSIAQSRQRLSCRKRHVLYHFRAHGSGPRGADTTLRVMRKAAVSLKKANPQVRSAGSTHGSAKNNSRVMMA